MTNHDKIKIGVNIITTHPYILTLLDDLSKQTYKNFCIVMVDYLYKYRKNIIKNFCEKRNLDIIHIPEKFDSRRIDGAKQATYRNEALAETPDNVERIVFLDDYQRIGKQFIEGHNKEKDKMVLGQWVVLKSSNPFSLDEDEIKKEIVSILDYNHESEYKLCKERVFYDIQRPAHFGNWWTSNASASREYIDAVGGFDERYMGGTGGEDYDLAYRIARKFNVSFIHEPMSIAYHYDHDIFCRPKKCEHNRNFFAENIYENGDKEECTDRKIVAYWNNEIKEWLCPECGKWGIVDSLQVFESNKRKLI